VYQVSTCFLSHASYNSCSASLGEEVELLIFFQPSTISVGLYDSLVLFISMEGCIFWGSTIFLGTILTWNAQIPFVSARTTLAIIRFHDLHYDTWNLESVLYIFYNSALVHMLACFSGNNGGGSLSHNDRI
jgi:hypothetical protein